MSSAADYALKRHGEEQEVARQAREEVAALRKQAEAEKRKEEEDEATIRLRNGPLWNWFPRDTEWRFIETWTPRLSLEGDPDNWDIWESGEVGTGKLVRLMVSGNMVRYVTDHKDGRGFDSQRWRGALVHSPAEIGQRLQNEIDQFNHAAESGEMDR